MSRRTRAHPVREWTRDLTMGVGFAFSGRQGWIRTVLTAVGVGLGVAMLLLAAAVPKMMGAQESRGDARSVNGSVAGNVTAEDDAKATDRTVLSEDAGTKYHSLELYGRTLQADGDHPVTPPGTDRVPGPGEMLVSPALKKLLASDEGAELAHRLDARVVGVIGDEGLLGPHELAFYLGSDKLKPDDAARVKFFGEIEQRQPVDPVLILLGTVACAVLLMPVAIFIGTAARFGGERRDQRLAALRLVGADAAMTRRIAAGESLAGGLLGMLFGGLVFVLGRQLIGSVTLFGLSVFPSDVVPDVWLGALVLLGVPLMTVGVSVFALRGVTIEPVRVVRENTPRPRRLWWRLLPPFAGLALLLPLAGALRGGGEVNEIQVVSGVVLLLGGIALLLPWAVERLVGMLRGGPVSWQLAVRRLQLSSGTATRAVSGITVAVAGAVALQLLFAGAEADTSHPTGLKRTADGTVSVTDTSAGSTDARQLTRALKNTEGVASATGFLEGNQAVEGKKDAYTEVFVGSCATLRELADLDSCREGQVFRAMPGKQSGEDDSVEPPPPAGSALKVAGPGGHGTATWRIPARTPAVTGKRSAWGMPFAGVLVTPSALPADRLDSQYSAWVRLKDDEPEAMEHVRTTVFRHDPAAFAMPIRDREPSAAFRQVSRGIFAAASAVLVLIGASMVISQLEQLRERKRQLAVLVAFGTRRTTLGASVLWQTAIPVALGLALATGFGIGLGWALLRMIGQSVTDWSSIVPMLGAGTAVIATVTLLSMPQLWRLMRPDGLRTE
ncbi:ABC transporter permease [Streptomyces oryzae]|uniref:ABC transporter permease n=1 Tax=Streptomyces oryzae TaxID=1434886 RepID=A0ABS3XE34_9ACTN|nr:ABC transporter permease [Streptomyces oryzae]MBO8193648.1 ABC transporter permease [Streptomyces oryzae]